MELEGLGDNKADGQDNCKVRRSQFTSKFIENKINRLLWCNGYLLGFGCNYERLHNPFCYISMHNAHQGPQRNSERISAHRISGSVFTADLKNKDLQS